MTDVSKNLYLKQKGLSGYENTNKYGTVIKIKDVTNFGSSVRIRDSKGVVYSHLVNLKNGDWHENLKAGNNVRVFVIERIRKVISRLSIRLRNLLH